MPTALVELTVSRLLRGHAVSHHHAEVGDIGALVGGFFWCSREIYGVRSDGREALLHFHGFVEDALHQIPRMVFHPSLAVALVPVGSEFLFHPCGEFQHMEECG